MNGRGRRRKGGDFERLLARLLRPIWPDAARGQRQTRKGSDCADVEGTGWWIEAKHQNAVNADAAYDQALDAGQDDGRPPVVIWRKTGSPKIKATLAIDDLVKLVSALPPEQRQALVTMRLEDWMDLHPRDGDD